MAVRHLLFSTLLKSKEKSHIIFFPQIGGILFDFLSLYLCRYLHDSSWGLKGCVMTLSPAGSPVSVSISLKLSPRVELESNVLLHGTETLPVHCLCLHISAGISMSLAGV
jgi:hypothetical protein